MYKNELMFLSLILSAIVFAIIACIKDRKTLQDNIRRGYKECLLCGLSNAVANLLIMVLALVLPASFMFPLISVGSIIITVLASVSLYKERLSQGQFAGIFLGLLAIVGLNL